MAFGNGNILNISRIGSTYLTKDINFADVLVVPTLTKNHLYVSKLTFDSPVDVLFSNKKFSIQKRATKEVLAKGRFEHKLYVLEPGHKALVYKLNSCRLCASYELWHNRLRHVSFYTTSLLQNFGYFFVTSLFPKPIICSSCEFSKSHKLPFPVNEK